MSAIPPSLRERLRSTTGSDLPSPRDGKDFVLYVLRTAFRAASNPSLEVALRMASALGLPLVCVAVVEDGCRVADGCVRGGFDWRGKMWDDRESWLYFSHLHVERQAFLEKLTDAPDYVEDEPAREAWERKNFPDKFA